MVLTPNGDSWLVYHAWRYGKIGLNPPGRPMMLDKIQWNQEGWPIVGSPSDAPMPVPICSQTGTNDDDYFSDITLPEIYIV